MWKYPVLLALTVSVMLLNGCSETTESAAPGPAFGLSGGGELHWEDYRGQWVLVNYWAEWCRPCLEEIPELNDVDAIEGVTVMAVNFDGITGTELEELGERMGIAFTMLTDDPAPALGWTLPGALPATFVVNPQGELTETLLGPQTEEELLALMNLSDSR